MDAVSTSGTAMDAVSTSSTAMDAVSTSSTAMDAVSTSSTAMDAVSTSSTAMDAVSVSDTALDAIWQSALAWDTVKTLAMAVGKFVAGRAGLDGANYAGIDAVTGDQSAMDAVSTSSTAMDAVSVSELARSSVFGSDYALTSLWASTPGARTILEDGGSPTLPHAYNDDRSTSSGTYLRIEDGSDISLPGDATSALEIEVVNSEDPYRRGLTLQLDLSNASTLEFQMRADSVPDSRIDHGVEVDGDTLFTNSGNSSWTNRSVGVSSYGATHDVLFFTDTGSWTGGDWKGYFSEINLI